MAIVILAPFIVAALYVVARRVRVWIARQRKARRVAIMEEATRDLRKYDVGRRAINQ